jgi:trehalose synthase
MVIDASVKNIGVKRNTSLKTTRKPRAVKESAPASQPAHGVVYSKRLNLCPFTAPPLKDYTPIIGDERTSRVQQAAERLKGYRCLELNATAQGGGVAEMLYSSVPFLNNLGVETEWKVINGNNEFFKCTKGLHNLLQGMKGNFTQEMERAYYSTIADCACSDVVDPGTDVIIVNDPQPLGLARHLKKAGTTWLWRCHIDIEEAPMDENPGLWDFMTNWMDPYDAAILSAAHYVVTRWPLPSFIIPPFIDPLSEKNRELSQTEINRVLDKYGIESKIPVITQIGRFDPWKGLDRTIAVFRHVRKELKCQLVLAGGMASDDPEGARILTQLREWTKNDKDIHILLLSLDDRLENWREVNALQRSANVIVQPSTREGFGLVITEALWKAKPVIAANVGAISLQIRDGDTGYFYETPQKTARRVINMLKNPQAAQTFGQRAKEYVCDHFLMPDRIADYLNAMDMAINSDGHHTLPKDCIISFHPWFKMSKRRK